MRAGSAPLLGTGGICQCKRVVTISMHVSPLRCWVMRRAVSRQSGCLVYVAQC